MILIHMRYQISKKYKKKYLLGDNKIQDETANNLQRKHRNTHMQCSIITYNMSHIINALNGFTFFSKY